MSEALETTSLSLKNIERSLVQVSEISGDITEDIYKIYFKRCTDSEALMQFTEDRERGKMMTEVFRLLLEEDLQGQFDYLCFETKTHSAYGVEPRMYDALFSAVFSTAKTLLGSRWLPEFESAWKQRISELSQAIHAAQTLKA